MARRGRTAARPSPRYAPSDGTSPLPSDAVNVGAALRSVWLAVIVFACWAGSVMWLTHGCAHHTYDYRLSTATCTVRRSEDGAACLTVPPHCWSAHSIQAVSPRWLSNAAAWGGPLWAWVPLIAWATTTGGRQRADAAVRQVAGLSMLACCASAVAFVVLSTLFRYAADHAWLLGRWDPSGHVFTYVFTALPLWFTASMDAQTGWSALPRWLRVWTALLTTWLLFGTLTTSAFFHSRADVAVPLSIGVACLWAFQRLVARLPLFDAWQQLSRWRTAAVWGAVVGIVVGASTVVAVGKPWQLVAAYAAFDTAVLSAVWWVTARQAKAAPAAQPASPV
jgi:hypothetical protein